MIAFAEHHYSKKQITVLVDWDKQIMAAIHMATEDERMWLGVQPVDFLTGGLLANVSEEFWEWVPEL